ncbi:transcriptional regulator with XRE-family HTH domain [Sphingomonas zeicaulis]|uniref:helix-turn-helix transcriptional regulator n=1 Tax=Sphingomonas zeicaulis TaxID=1632740 RepID=UPI003D227354
MIAQPAKDDALPGTLAMGPALRRWRALHRVKQAHAAELFGVAQSTISRWEAGAQAMEPAEHAKVAAVVAARLDAAADRVLAQLVSESPRPVHLVCDLTHKLLALSPSRAAGFGCPPETLIGRSLWPFATDALRAMEARLADLGWHDGPGPAPVEFQTGANRSTLVPVRHSLCRWTRILLSDGTAARIVETLA